MDTLEGDSPSLPEHHFIKQEVTYDLVPFTEEEVCDSHNVKQEPPDNTEDDIEVSQEITIKEEYFSSEEYLTVDEYETPNEEFDCTEENDNYHSKVSAFTSSTTIPCLTVMKPGLKEKRITSCKNTSKRGKNSLTDSIEKACESGKYLQRGKYFRGDTLSVNFDFDKTQLNKPEVSCEVEKEISVSKNISREALQENKNIGAGNKASKNSTLTMLKNSHSQVMLKRYECHICGKSYNHASNRYRHMRTHLLNKASKNSTLTMLKTVNFDFDKTQLNKPEVSCEVEKEISVSKNIGAGNKASKNSTLTMLKNSHSQVMLKRYECHICGKSYNHASNRYRHMRTHLLKRHVCELCGKSFEHIGALNEHKLHHTIGEQQFLNVRKGSFTAAKNAAKTLNPKIKKLSKSSAPVQLQKNKVSENRKPELPASSMTTLHTKFPMHNKLKATIGHKQTFPCNVCNKSFSWHYLLKRHKQKHLTKNNVKNNVPVKDKHHCIICKKTFCSKYQLIRHEGRETHKVQLNLIQSKLKETETPKHSCDVCNKIFSCSLNLRRHRETQVHKLNVKAKLEETSEQKHSCNTCEKSFASLHLLKKHELTHFNSYNKDQKMKGILYTCQVCKRSFFWLNDVRKHLISPAHLSNVDRLKNAEQNKNDKVSYPCNVCGKIFFQQRYLTRHQRASGHELQARRVACDVCGLKFFTEVHLKKHQAMVGHLADSKNKPRENFKVVHSCDRCGKTFPWLYQLNNHKISHMAKKYPCNICGKYFAAEYLLKKHKIVHSKRLTNLSSEKLPHVKVTVCTCNICGEKFAQLNRLKKHKAMCHRLCENPENKDSNNIAINFHFDKDVLPTSAEVEQKSDIKLVHTCLICSKTFSRLKDLHKHSTKTGHLMLVHKQENGKANVGNKTGYSCDVCGKILSRLSDLNKHKTLAGHNTHIYKNSYTQSENTYDIKTKYSLPDTEDHHKSTPLSTDKTDENKAYPCNTCNRKFSRQSDLSRHRNKSGHSFQPEGILKKTLNKGSQEHYFCGTCNKTFSRQNDLRRHVAVTGHAYEALISENGNSNKNNNFSSNNTSIRVLSHPEEMHMQKQPTRNMSVALNAQESGKSYPCHTCCKTFSWQYQLKNHKCHGPIKKFSCKMCDKHFSQEYLLKRHKLLHASHSDKMKTGPGAYACNTCHRVFSRLSDLSRHSNLSGHIGNKLEPKFYCQFCNRFFWRLCDLKRHENKSGHHSYVQNVQEKEFDNFTKIARKVVSQTNNVTKHSSIGGHTSNMNVANEKANSKNMYQCKVCKRSYSWKSSLCKHKAATGHM